MEIDGETKTCPNCDKIILIQQFDLHEVYCQRNITKCPQCFQPIEKTQLDEHINEAHTKTFCRFCKKEFEYQQIQEHEVNCNQKPQPCLYCFMPIDFDNYAQHVKSKQYFLFEKVYECGSRTEKCEFCKRNILLRDLDQHYLDCSKDQQQEVVQIDDESLESYVSGESYGKQRLKKQSKNVLKDKKAGKKQNLYEEEKKQQKKKPEKPIKPIIYEKHQFKKESKNLEQKQTKFTPNEKQKYNVIPNEKEKYNVIPYRQLQQSKKKKFLEQNDDDSPIINSKPKPKLQQQQQKIVDYDEIELQKAIQESLKNDEIPEENDYDLQKAIEYSNIYH